MSDADHDGKTKRKPSPSPGPKPAAAPAQPRTTQPRPASRPTGTTAAKPLSPKLAEAAMMRKPPSPLAGAVSPAIAAARAAAQPGRPRPQAAVKPAQPNFWQKAGAILNFDIGDWATKKVDHAGAKWAAQRGNQDLAAFFQNDLKQHQYIKQAGLGQVASDVVGSIPGQLQGKDGRYSPGSVLAGVGNLSGLGDVKGLLNGTDFKGEQVNPYQAGFNLGLGAVMGVAGRGASAAERGAVRQAEQGAGRQTARVVNVALPGGGRMPVRIGGNAPMNTMTRPGRGGVGGTGGASGPSPMAVAGRIRRPGRASVPGASGVVGKVAGPGTKLPPGYQYLNTGVGARPRWRIIRDLSSNPAMATAAELKVGTGRVIGVGSQRLSRGTSYMAAQLKTAGQTVPRGYQIHHLIPDQLARNSPLVIEAMKRGLFDIDSARNMMAMPSKSANLMGINPKTILHDGSHGNYTADVRRLLDGAERTLKSKYGVSGLAKLPPAAAADLKAEFSRIQADMRHEIQSASTTVPTIPDPVTGRDVLRGVGTGAAATGALHEAEKDKDSK